MADRRPAGEDQPMGIFKRQKEPPPPRCPICRELLPEEEPRTCPMCGSTLSFDPPQEEKSATVAEPTPGARS